MCDSSFKMMVGLGGLEPPTSRLSGVRSNHLSYKPICLSFLAMTVLLSVAAVLMYASTLRASLLRRLVLSKKSCAFFAHAFLKIHSAET